ncbi:MAG: phosphatidylglycerophosphatase A [Nitrospira sp.]|nr:phosphatidylglycerophosphatase A [bacterium]MBL7050347.1 phosphatidylglycerophosphatase A [Nitrospira sp.]
MLKFQIAIATLGGIGYIPYAPGTFGSAAALIPVFLIAPSDGLLLMMLVPLLLLGTLASHSAETVLGQDSGSIVIDELCGSLIAVLFLPKTAGYVLAAFLLFRLFDIWKPWPIGRIDRSVHGGIGIMLDDVLAGIFANLCLQGWVLFSVWG